MTIVGKTPSAALDARAAAALVTSRPLELEDPVAPRRCGRCRQLFDGDPALHAAAIPDWWLCATCRVALGVDRKPGPASRQR